jgi:hypothetical protein
VEDELMDTTLWLAAVLSSVLVVGHQRARSVSLPDAPTRESACAVVAARPSLFEIALQPTTQVRGAQGTVHLAPAPSPFGIAVTADGHYRLRATVQVDRLPAPSSLGAYTTYVAWAATTNLQETHRLGALDASGQVAGDVMLNKFMIFISAERSGDVTTWSGPVVLRGIAPSALMQNLLTHPLNNGGMPPC